MSDNKTNRKLAAIMFADIVSYSRLMGANESETLKLLNDFEEISAKIIKEFEGIIIKKNGDQIFCEFSSAKNAVDASLELQDKLSEYNDSRPKDYKLEVRIGIHIGDIVKKENDIFGDGVNVAARIQPLASPGGICVSGAVSESLTSHPDYDIISKGEQDLKNILQKHTIFQIKTGHEAIEPVISKPFIKTKEKSSNPNTKYWIIISPFLLIAILFSFVILQKIVKDAIKSFSDKTDTFESAADSGNSSNLHLKIDRILLTKVNSNPDHLEFVKGKLEDILPQLTLVTLDEVESNAIYDEFLSEVEMNYNSNYIEYFSVYDYMEYFHNIGENIPAINYLYLKAFFKLDFSGENIFDQFMALNHKYLKKKGSMSSFMTQTKSLYGYFPLIYKLDDKLSEKYAVFHTVSQNLITINEGDTSASFNMKPNYDIIDRENLIKFMSSYLNEQINIFTATNIATIKDVSENNIIFTADANTINRISPKMIFKIERGYYWKNDHKLIDEILDLRKKDLISYEDQVNKDTTSKYYTNYHNDKYTNTVFEMTYTRQELDYIASNNHFMHSLKNRSDNFSGGVGGATGIKVQINSIYDTTISATVYGIDNPNIILRAGDLFKY